MEIRCHREPLSRCLAVVARAAATHSALPVLANVLLDASDGVLRLSATDLTVAVSLDVPGATIVERGSLTAPARLVSDLVKSLPGETVTLRGEDGALAVLADRFDTHVRAIPADEFPAVALTGEPLARLRWATLQRAIRQVAIAASKEESRPVLTGLLLRLQGAELTVAAADGFRLAEANVAVDEAHGELEVVVPAAALLEAARLPGNGEQTVEVLASPGGARIGLRFPGGQVAAQSIEGRFPDYRQVIPGQAVTRVVGERAALLKAARIGAQFLDDLSGPIVLSVTGDGVRGGQLRVEAANAELGDTCTVEPISMQGPDMTVRIAARYLIDGLAAIESAQAALELTDPSTAIVLRPADEACCLYVAMPILPTE